MSYYGHIGHLSRKFYFYISYHSAVPYVCILSYLVHYIDNVYYLL